MDKNLSSSKAGNSKGYSVANDAIGEAKPRAGEYFCGVENKSKEERRTGQFLEREEREREYARGVVTQSNVEAVVEHASPGIAENEKARIVESTMRQDPLVAMEHLIAMNEERNRGNFAALTSREFFDSLQGRDLYTAVAVLSVLGWAGNAALTDGRLRSEEMWGLYDSMGAGGTSNWLASISTTRDVGALTDGRLVQNPDLREMCKDAKFASEFSKLVTASPDGADRVIANLSQFRDMGAKAASEMISAAWVYGPDRVLSPDAMGKLACGKADLWKGIARAEEGKEKILMVKLGDDTHDRGAKLVAHDLIVDGHAVMYVDNPQSYKDIADAAMSYGATAIGFSLTSDSQQRIAVDTMNYLRARGHGDALFFGGGAITANASSNLAKSGIQILARSGDVVDFVKLSKLHNPQPQANIAASGFSTKIAYGGAPAGMGRGVSMGASYASAPEAGTRTYARPEAPNGMKFASAYSAVPDSGKKQIGVPQVGGARMPMNKDAKGNAAESTHYETASPARFAGLKPEAAELANAAQIHRTAYDARYAALTVSFQNREVRPLPGNPAISRSGIPISALVPSVAISSRLLHGVTPDRRIAHGNTAREERRTEPKAKVPPKDVSQARVAMGIVTSVNGRAEYAPIAQYPARAKAVLQRNPMPEDVRMHNRVEPEQKKRILSLAIDARQGFAKKDEKKQQHAGNNILFKDGDDASKRKAPALPSGASSHITSSSDHVGVGDAKSGAAKRKKGKGYGLLDFIERLLMGLFGKVESVRTGRNERKIQNLLLRTADFEGGLRGEAEQFGIKLHRNADGSYYDVLGVNYGSDRAQIKNAYVGLVKKHHPDVSKEIDAEDIMKRINEAYSVLGDGELRGDYDRKLASGATEDDSKSAERITQELLRQYLRAREEDLAKFEKMTSVPLDRQSAVAAVKDFCDWKFRFEKARHLALGKLMRYGKSIRRLRAANDRLLRNRRSARHAARLEENGKALDGLLKEYARIERMMDGVTKRVRSEIKAQEERVTEKIWSSIPY